MTVINKYDYLIGIFYDDSSYTNAFKKSINVCLYEIDSEETELILKVISLHDGM